jgi:carboxypeptidase Q
MNRFKTGFLALTFIFFTISVSAQSIYEPSVDHEIVEQIKEQGLYNSQIMNMAGWLTDVYGPRLSNSPQLNRAHEWTQEQFREMGLTNIHLHSYGPFGKGWELKRFALHANTPYTYFPVTAFPKAWSPGYDEPVKGEVIYLSIQHIDELDQYRGELSDKFVMLEYPYEAEQSWDPIATRTSNERLLNLANAKEDFSPDEDAGGPSPAALARSRDIYTLMTFLQEEQPLAILDQSYRGWYGQIAVSGAQLPNEPGTPWGERINPYMPDTPDAVPQISLAREHYGRIFRLLEKDIPVTLELELQVEFQEDDLFGYNSIAEIPGTDPELQEEIVMLGAHIDSWHAATGAADNASGTVVMMEVMRILTEIGIEPRRTIRIALWGNEEQGLHGSREYVSDHFAVQTGNDGEELDKRDDYENLSAYYNIDNGTGQVRGIYLQGNEQLRQIFRAWLSPFDEWDANTVSFANTGGTDHLSFHRVGLPGFQFIQDPIEYFTMTHHSNQDFYERLVEDDLKRTAIIVATFVYHTAMLDERLPRIGELDFPVTQ